MLHVTASVFTSLTFTIYFPWRVSFSLEKKKMLRSLLIYVAVMTYSTVCSEPDNALRSKNSEDPIHCERGWYNFRDKCYKAFARKPSERLPWNRALERCRSYGGDLASIQSQAEQDFIFFYLQLDVNSYVWIGLNKPDKDSDFEWSDGSVVNYTNWEPNEPSGVNGKGAEEYCVNLAFAPQLDVIGKWNDRECGVHQTFVCEKNSNPRKKSPNPVYCSSEDGGGWKYQSSCYHIVTEKMSWENAERHCRRNYNGHLADILDKIDDLFLDYILDDLRKDMWIGIKIQDQLQQKWSSGWYVSYDGFSKEQLQFKDGTCTARRTRKEWITIPCTQRLPFICEVSKVKPPILKAPAKGSHCPVEVDDWRDLGGEYCYYFEKEKSLNFYQASFDCQRRGGNLVSLHSKEESDMLLPFVKYSGYYFYIGLFRILGREEEFAWTDGSPLDYENWKSNEPNDLEEKCVEAFTLLDSNGVSFTWNDNNCEIQRGYICSVKKIAPISTDDDSCTNFCIARSSHLHEMANLSPDAKRKP